MKPIVPVMDSSDEPRPRPKHGLAWIAGVLVGAALVSGALYVWLTADSTLAFEQGVIEGFDGRWQRQSEPSWCEATCSESGHEWHTREQFSVVLDELGRQAELSEFEYEVERVADDAALVLLSSGDESIEVGVTSASWAGASADAEGTAVWFTSVSVFDQ